MKIFNQYSPQNQYSISIHLKLNVQSIVISNSNNQSFFISKSMFNYLSPQNRRTIIIHLKHDFQSILTSILIVFHLKLDFHQFFILYLMFNYFHLKLDDQSVFTLTSILITQSILTLKLTFNKFTPQN